MKLRNKTFLFILAAWSIMFLVVLVGVRLMLINNYLQVESKLSADAVSRIHGALEQQVNAVGETANLWGIWDDAYKYAQDKNQNFLDQALSIASMSAAHLDLAIIFDVKGNILFQRKLNEEQSQEVAMPKTILQSVAPEGKLWTFIEKQTEKSAMRGLFADNGQLLILGEHSIVTNAGTGPARGAFLVGKTLTKSDWKAVQDSTQLRADLIPISEINNNNKYASVFNQLSANNEAVNLDRVDNKNIHAFAFIKDVNNKPIALMQVFLLRDVYSAGLASIWHFVALFLLLGIVFTLLLFFLLGRIVIHPLESINKEIVVVGQTKNFQTRIPVEGDDEISNLAKEFNKMFATISDYDQKNKVYSQEITDKLASSKILRDKLQKTETFLTDVINSMPSALLVIDKDMNITKVNNQAEMEKRSEVALGQSLFQCFPYLSQYANKIASVFETSKSQMLTKIVDHNQTETRHYNALIFPLKKENSISIRIDDVTSFFKLQEQIMQNDKLASIGMLTAGVVNEINDPIDECFAIVTPLKSNLALFMELVHKYQDLSLNEAEREKIVAINAESKQLGLSELMIKTDNLLNDLQTKAADIAGIVKILQNFSRLDEDVMKKTNVHEGINSTLILLMHRYKSRVRITKNFADLPLIDCFPGRLNQVYMNIISNAFDAISGQGELVISTTLKDDNHIEIRFKDDGIGISPENLKNIFEPFFTTKDVKKVTGLGLSITRSIIENMEGTIEVQSSLGQGCEFIIILPINAVTS